MAEAEAPPPVLAAPTVDALVDKIKAQHFKNVVVMCGAGISTAAGIPDFRSKGTGLYDNLQKYNLPRPTSMFEISYFRSNPDPFFMLAKELFPGRFKPTPVHYFLTLLDKMGVLRRVYTQNIDTLERLAGLDPDKLVEAHGTMASAHCLYCRKEYTTDDIKDTVLRGQVPHCDAPDCEGVIKPDIVFFGEPLPQRFHTLVKEDFGACDLLIVMGTSLAVQPFANLVHLVGSSCPRVLINREKVGALSPEARLHLIESAQVGFRFDHEDNVRDIAVLGDIQEEVLKLADLLGWKDDLATLIQAGDEAFARAQERMAAEEVARQAVDELVLAESLVALTPTTAPAVQATAAIPLQGGGFAVHPKTDCPHVADAAHVSLDGLDASAVNACAPCADCGDTSENWFCLKCHEYRCSRYVKEHFVAHHRATSHAIGISLSDLSFWCFACDSYIEHPSLHPIRQAVARAKFDE